MTSSTSASGSAASRPACPPRRWPRCILRDAERLANGNDDVSNILNDGALTIEDLRRIAKRRTPKAAFDYTDGAADGVFAGTSTPNQTGRIPTHSTRTRTSP